MVVGYHLMLDGPHALRCVLSNIRRFMRSMYAYLFLDEQVPSGKDQRTCSVDTYFERRVIGSKKTGEQVALAT